MDAFILPFVAALFIMMASLAGVVFASDALTQWMRSKMPYLTTFSAGVFIVLSFSLVQESLHEGASLLSVLFTVGAGALFFELLNWFSPTDHHHHHIEHDHEHTPIDGRRVLLSDALHNVSDGILLVPAFLVDVKVGIGVTLGIFFHELVQEISEYFVLRDAGYSQKKALTYNFLASTTILLGVVAAAFFASFESYFVILGGFAAGGFLSVVLRDLIPHAYRAASRSGRWTPHIIAALLGALLMLGLATLLPHEHGEEHEGEEVHVQV